VTILNAAVADGFTEIIESLKARLRTSNTIESAVLEVVKEAIQDTHPIRFEGNNYSEDWVSEAERRGIPNLRKTPEALAELTKPKSKAMLARMGIFTEAEVVSRFHVRTERYVKNLLIEIDTLCSMVETQILPAAYAYHGMLAAAVLNCKSLGTTAPQADVLTRLGGLISSLQTKRMALETVFHKVEALSSEEEKAVLLAHDITLAMSDVRQVCDELESIVADDYWPLPKYREILFLS
jgi:glutamine synthetase